MEARDTVIPGHYSPEEFTRLNKQAEISFKAGIEQGLKQIDDEELITKVWKNGEKVGRKEVVKWIHNHKFTYPASIFDEWQAKLKEWGIE